MADTPSKEQDARNANVTMRVTRVEKRAVQLVAAYRDVTESDLLRELTIDEIMAESARLFPALAERQSA